ncbi:hypothetical protein [Sphingobium sp. DN12]|uniref:hypothetical protein n=1 Tax=Sphingobium sp. DN12 TaxID=3378073 RepID=UPI003DA5481D
MDALYFLKSRTAFICFFFAESAKAFVDVKHRIENELPPFDDPPYSEDPEPAYLEEWMDAEQALSVLGITCVSMLSDTLKLYFKTLSDRVIGFSFENQKKAFAGGFVPAYFEALGEILETDWNDCKVDRALIEQIVLARNRGQHGECLTTLTVSHDKATLEKHPRPYFIGDDEISTLTSEDGSFASFLMPTIKVTAEALLRAIGEVEALGEYVESRLDKAHEWRMRQRKPAEA